MIYKLSELADDVEIGVEETNFVYTAADLKREIKELEEPHHETRNWFTLKRRKWTPSAEHMVEMFVESEGEDMYENWEERANDCIEKAGAIEKIQAILDETFKDNSATVYWTYEKPVQIDIFPPNYLKPVK